MEKGTWELPGQVGMGLTQRSKGSLSSWLPPMGPHPGGISGLKHSPQVQSQSCMQAQSDLSFPAGDLERPAPTLRLHLNLHAPYPLSDCLHLSLSLPLHL